MWRRLSAAEEHRIWSKIEDLGGYSGFVPEGVCEIRTFPEDFAFYADDNIEPLAELHVKFLAAFRQVDPKAKLLALDWEHPCYEVDLAKPFEAGANLESLCGYLLAPTLSPVVFPIPYLPESDYYMHVAPDVSYGLWGHPWRREIMIFGESFVAAVTANPPTLWRHWPRK